MEDKDLFEKLNRAKLTGLKADSRMAFDRKVIETVKPKKAVAAGNAWARYATALLAVAAVSAVTFYIVDNMDDGDRFNKNGGVWSTFTDAHDGGDSVVWPEESHGIEHPFIMSSPGYGGTGWAARITGRAGTKIGANYSFFGLVVRFSSESQCPVCKGADISKYSGIRFKIKGSVPDGKLVFVLPHEGEKCLETRATCGSLTNYADYEFDLTPHIGPEWQAIAIDFKNDLKQPFWAKPGDIVPVETVLKTVHLFKWQVKDSMGGAVDVWIDDLELY